MDNIYPVKTKVSKKERVSLMQQQPIVIWFTGLSGSGKSTLAVQLEAELYRRSIKTYLLDGDNIRKGLNKDLGFSDEDRMENVRRVGEVSKLLIDAGLVVIASFISPFKVDRQHVRSVLGDDNYLEIFVDCPLDVCEKRDTKGLYKKARRGEIKNFSGIDSPYEKPEHPNLVIRSHEIPVENALEIILKLVLPRITYT